MDRIQQYLEIVPLPVLLAIAVFGTIFMIVLPAKYRMWVFLTGLPLWLALSRFIDLGVLQAASKSTGMLYFGILAFSAFVHPGPKRKIPGILWLYPVLGLLSTFYVLGASDMEIAVVLRVQWFTLTLAALMVVRTITSQEQLIGVLYSLFVGTTAAGMLAFAAVLKDPAGAFGGGLGRVQPWGANQNQVGPLFILMTPLGLYFGMRSRTPLLKLMAFGAFAIGGLMALLTASRSVVFPTAGVLAVLGWEFRRKPLVIAGAVLAVIPVLLFSGGLVADANVDRLGSLESERFSRWAEYLEVIRDHPMTGIMFQEGELAASAEEVGGHAHNAFLDALRVYGLSLCIPLFALAGWSCWCAYIVWRRRNTFTTAPLLFSMLTAFMAMVYVHGMVTIVIYYANYAWSFFHILLASLFITLAASKGHELVIEETHDWHDDYAYDPNRPGWSTPYPPERAAPALASGRDVKQAG